MSIISLILAFRCAGLTGGMFVGSLTTVSIVCCKYSIFYLNPLVNLLPSFYLYAVILTVRVWALWKGSYIILTILFLLLANNIMVFLLMYGLSLLRGTVVLYASPYTGCMVIPNSKILWIMFTSTLAFESLSTGLIVYKSWPLARRRDVEVPLFSLLLEDGIGYCLCLIASKLFVVGCLYVPSVVATVEIPASICISVSSVAANRLILRLQQTILKKSSNGAHDTTAGFSTARDYKGGDDGDGDKEIITFGGSDKNGRRVHARRHSHIDDELFSFGKGDVEMSFNKKGRELHATDSSHRTSTSFPTSTTSGSSSNMDVPAFESKQCDAV
jgi:hypothetical protein